MKSNKGILLVNLGSPDTPAVKDVRRYLNEFLMDKRVLDIPYPIRRFIVNFFILPKRPKYSAEAYRSIWQEEGSPLILISEKVQKLLQEQIDLPVSLGMRYGNPTIKSALEVLLEKNVKEILLIPLYPHYAISTFESVVEKTKEELAKLNTSIKLEIIPPFYKEDNYINALLTSAEKYLREDYDFLLFSYHGLPERHIIKSDPTGSHCLSSLDCCKIESPAHATCYRHQVLETTKAFVKKANIPESKYAVAFQSRLGRQPWLHPYTDLEIKRLAESGIKKLSVICPSFVSDCLETLEEIGIRGKEIFLNNGGKEFTLIPCLNDSPEWIQTLKKYCLS
jgi:ferrochelatase